MIFRKSVNVTWVILFVILLSGGHAMKAKENIRKIYFEIDLKASVNDVWEAWTTEAGVKTFFAPGCNIDFRIDGMYEIFFFPEAPAGQRGAEGMRIMAIEPGKMFSFTWNQTPDLPKIRPQRTLVTLKFAALDENTTRLIFLQTGWGDGPDWDKSHAYFVKAWGDVVLPRLQKRFLQGPVDWNNSSVVSK